MAAALGLSITGALHIYQRNATPDSLSFWKAGSAMIVVVWLMQVFWSIFSLVASDGKTYGPAHQGSTAVSIFKNRHISSFYDSLANYLI